MRLSAGLLALFVLAIVPLLALSACGDAQEEADAASSNDGPDAPGEASVDRGATGNEDTTDSRADGGNDSDGASISDDSGRSSGGVSDGADASDDSNGQDAGDGDMGDGSDGDGDNDGGDGDNGSDGDDSGDGGNNSDGGNVGDNGDIGDGEGSALAAPLESARIFHVGHSLVNHDMPRMLEQVATDDGRDHAYAVQIINGANLQWQWNNSSSAEGEDARAVLPAGNHDVLVLTEAVPLDNHLTWSDTEEYAGRFYALAVEANPQARVFLYETWHCTHSGTSVGCEWDDGDDVPWRDRLTADAAKWQGIVDQVNATHDGPPMRVIPVGQAMAVLHDRIAAGGVYSLDDIRQLFSDDIHLTPEGNYFVAMVHYAAIYRRSPVGLTEQTNDIWGTPFPAPHEPLAWTMQEIAWEVVSSDPAYGVLLDD